MRWKIPLLVAALNIGGKNRILYALMGDTVNTATTIEGLTREFLCDIILGQTTHGLPTGAFITEQLSAVKVKGKKKR